MVEIVVDAVRLEEEEASEEHGAVDDLPGRDAGEVDGPVAALGGQVLLEGAAGVGGVDLAGGRLLGHGDDDGPGGLVVDRKPVFLKNGWSAKGRPADRS